MDEREQSALDHLNMMHILDTEESLGSGQPIVSLMRDKALVFPKAIRG